MYAIRKKNYKFPRYWKNQSGGGQKPQRSFQRENSWVQPPKADKEKAEAQREYITTSASRDKQKQRDFRLITFKSNTLKRSRPEKAASYGYKSKPDGPEPSTAVASGWARGGANDLRELILSKRGHRNSGAVRAKQFKNEYYAEHNGITSEAMFQTSQRRFKSHYNFKEHRVVSGNKLH
jgi:hypothetical protein